jgi:hypothetical protein
VSRRGVEAVTNPLEHRDFSGHSGQVLRRSVKLLGMQVEAVRLDVPAVEQLEVERRLRDVHCCLREAAAASLVTAFFKAPSARFIVSTTRCG